ncbi:hypothetical protein D9756_011489 [Leucocoprinus leucothites]|uniref:Uncharacterized protein n=1 Tax=Leucocoprinus leucothites TaxID=201217 RepID=A0A8H5CRC7_9AGAR|nr:hypothetical protein D9756_011489 [Leucoagaricus leucothites]
MNGVDVNARETNGPSRAISGLDGPIQVWVSEITKREVTVPLSSPEVDAGRGGCWVCCSVTTTLRIVATIDVPNCSWVRHASNESSALATSQYTIKLAPSSPQPAVFLFINAFFIGASTRRDRSHLYIDIFLWTGIPTGAVLCLGRPFTQCVNRLRATTPRASAVGRHKAVSLGADTVTEVEGWAVPVLEVSTLLPLSKTYRPEVL